MKLYFTNDVARNLSSDDGILRLKFSFGWIQPRKAFCSVSLWLAPRSYVSLFHMSRRVREYLCSRDARLDSIFTGGFTGNNWNALTMDRSGSSFSLFFFWEVRLPFFCFLSRALYRFILFYFSIFRRVAIEKLIDTSNGARYSLLCRADFICNSKICCFIKRDSQIRTYVRMYVPGVRFGRKIFFSVTAPRERQKRERERERTNE